MKKWLFLFFTLFIFLISAYSQKSLSDYAYVLVPQQFEFQKGKDQFQVNTLMRHLLNQAGFNPIYDVELENLPRCEGLFLDLDLEPSFVYTKIKIILRDCNYNVVYQSQEGISKEKEYKKAFHEAIREAFRPLDKMGVNQGDLQSLRESFEKRGAAGTATETKVVKNASVSKDAMTTKSLVVYEFKGEKYYLEAKKNEFVIYQMNKTNQSFIEFGNLKETSRPGIYLFTKNGESLLANFDVEDNLLIDGVDAQGNPIQNKYSKVKEN